MNNLLKIPFGDRNILLNKFAKSGSSIVKSLKPNHFPEVVSFLKEKYGEMSIDFIDIFVMAGTLYVDNMPAYALYFDGDESNNVVTIKIGDRFINETVVADSPIVLISQKVLENDMLFKTTLVHELSHFMDGVAFGEKNARMLEYNFLCSVGKMGKEDASMFLAKKYLTKPE